MIRFHLDENVPSAIAEGLRRRAVGELPYGLIMIAECLSPEEMRNHVEYL